MSVSEAVKKAVNSRPLNALITETFDLALKQESELIEKNKKPFTFVAKDNFAVKNIKMTCATKMLENYIAPYTSTVVQKLIDNGGCLLGKSNMDGFAMGSTSSHSYFGPVKSSLSDLRNLDNDWRIAGGSSGGSAIAVHLGYADVALGSDTGGSTRNPAAFHGIFGFKPSYGTLSRHGLVPLANSFDVPAIFTKSIDDCQRFYEMMCGVDPMDSTSISPLPRKPIELKNLKIGLPKEYAHPMLSKNSLSMWNEGAALLKDAGCEIVEVELPHTEYSIVCYHILAETDIASNMARFDGISFGHRKSGEHRSFNDLLADSRTESLNDTIRRRIFVGNYYNVRENRGKYFQQAAKVRRLIKSDFDQVFQKVDALLTPVTSHSVPLYSEVKAVKFKSRQRQDDYFTQPANMAGLPAISVPFGQCDNGYPMGLQIICDYLQDYKCLDIAQEFYNLKKGKQK
uniref:Glutamyl-tRNA(Gln) amidotransferase subunit A, mitochondrial n=1 Tax=Panagrolaimus sp. JU765 TaxID=591449 RepID=A0AC34RF68_9BILA